MKKYNIALLSGIAFIALFVGIGIADIGEMGSCEPFPWHLPITIGLAFTIPFIIGILAGLNMKNKEKTDE